MKCNVCGRQIQNEEANFCEYCGSSFREQHTQASNNINAGYQGYSNDNNLSTGLPVQAGGMTGTPYTAQEDKPVSLLNFLGSYCIFFIPIAGWIIFVVMLFVWAFSNNTPASKKNWARATLIFLGIFIAFITVYLMYIMSTPIFQDMMNGNFNYDKYMQGAY